MDTLVKAEQQSHVEGIQSHVTRTLQFVMATSQGNTLLRVLHQWRMGMDADVRQSEQHNVIRCLSLDKAAAVWEQLMERSVWRKAFGAVLWWRECCVQQLHGEELHTVTEALDAEWRAELRHTKVEFSLRQYRGVLHQWWSRNCINVIQRWKQHMRLHG